MLKRLAPCLLLPLLLSACLDFGPGEETSSPSSAQVERSRAEMSIDPGAEIHPLGFKLISGIDDAIWFKFRAAGSDIAALFRSDVIDTAQFQQTTLLSSTDLPDWWDVEQHALTGGQVELPNGRFMNVGYYERDDESLVVYIFWHET